MKSFWVTDTHGYGAVIQAMDKESAARYCAAHGLTLQGEIVDPVYEAPQIRQARELNVLQQFMAEQGNPSALAVDQVMAERAASTVH